LFPLIQQVNDDQQPVTIVSAHGGNAVLVSEAEWSALEETAFLLRSQRNATRLLGSLAAARDGRYEERELIEPSE
jgi:antitoxin YefM